MSGEFATQWAFDDFVAASRLSARLNRGRQWMIALLAITVGIFFANPDSDLDLMGKALVFGLSMLVGILAIALGFWLVDRLILPIQARRIYDQQKIDGQVLQFEFDAGGIRVASPLGTSDLEWGHITGWTENDRFLLLFRTRLLFFCVPKAQVSPSAVEEIKDALVAASVPARK